MTSSLKSLPRPSNFALYYRLLKYARPFLWALFLALAGNILFSGVDASLTYMLKPLLNQGFIARDTQFIHLLPVLVLGAFLLRGLGNCIGTYFMSVVSRGVVMRLRQDIFRHLLYLPTSYYDHNSGGKILSTILYNVEQVANAGADALTDFIQAGCLIVGLLGVMISTSWRLSLLYFAAMPLIALTARWSSKRIRRISKSIQDQMGEVTHIAEENIEGYKVVRTFNGEEHEIQKFDEATKRNRHRELKFVVTKALSISGIQFLAGIALSLTIYLAVSHHTNIALSAGSFASLMAAMVALLKPLKTWTTVSSTIQKGLAGAQSIFALLEEPKEVDQGTVRLSRAKGKIDLQDVSFAYRGAEKKALRHINLSIVPGEMIALVGHSGGGKTTLVNLLLRFYDGLEGTIKIDDIDIRNIVLSDLRKQFSVVSQNVILFNDTVAHNIAYGQTETNMEDITAAAEAAYAKDFIEALPKGFDTVVGENGVLLSGGQRQRIAIARAILKNAPILILDEATSALDTESEQKIQLALENLTHQRTTIVIAHRLSTILNADRIAVFNHGSIIELGTHEELLALNQQYARLYQMQFKETP